jgi:dUTP pyrophosphatase
VRRFAGDELGPGPRGEAWSGALAIPAKGAAVDVPELPVRRLRPDLPLPAYAHPGDAGADLCAAEDVVLPPGGRATVGTGLAVAVPAGHAAFVHPRSGLAARHGITVVNAPGTVDAGYRGEVGVVLLNTDRHEPFTVHRGDRIAQLVVQPVTTVRFVDVEELPPTPRGEGGFGSTGR